MCSGCFLTSSSNSLTTVLAAYFTAGEIPVSCFGGGDDFVGITERSSLPALRRAYSITYGVKNESTGGLGLVMDGFKVSDSRFDFLSYDCTITHTGLEVVKQPLRVVRYGAATSVSTPDAEFTEAVRLGASSVVPPHYALADIPDRSAPLGEDYHLRGCTDDPAQQCPPALSLAKAQHPNGVYVGGRARF